MPGNIVLDKDHVLNVGPGAYLVAIAFCLLSFMIGFYDINLSFSIRMGISACVLVLVAYNCGINGKPVFDILFEKKPLKI